MQIIIYFFICIIATTIGGISGVGGGVIIKPLLDAISGMPVETISFLSSCTVLAMTITSMVRSISGTVKVDSQRGTPLAIGAAVGGIIGKNLFEVIRSAGGSAVSVIQQIIMIILTLGVLGYTLKRNRIPAMNVKNRLACLFIGLILGMLSAFLGIGGGPINLAVLYYFFSMSTKVAAINSLYVILFSQVASFIYTLFCNVLQTNGYALDEAWCRFFRDNHFLIGISVDGNRELHDGNRHQRDSCGPTYDRIIESIALLEQYDVPYGECNPAKQCQHLAK